MMLDLIDTHCHLDIPEFDDSRTSLLESCMASGMRAIVVPAVTRSTWDTVRQVCSESALLWPAFGLHPCYVAQHQMSDVDALDSYLQQGVVAVGEVGLDAFHGDTDLDQQLALLRAQIAVARNHRLPLIIHARKTQDLVLRELRRQRFEWGGVMHAFSGSQQQAERFIEAGFCIGFGGAATYDRAQKLRGILTAIPITSVVLETDSPDIPPSFARHEINTPFNLFRITEILADVMGIEVAALARQSTINALRAFPGLQATQPVG